MKIIVHSGSFHADELVAIALLKVFKVVSKDVEIIRTRDEAVIKDAKENKFFVIDVGAEYDGITNFDHHHDRNLRSSAGLILDYLKNTHKIGVYQNIEELVKAVDEHDLGVKKASMLEFSSLVSNYNGIPETADKDFMTALAFVEMTISAFKRDSDNLKKTEEVVLGSDKLFEHTLLLKDFTRQWDAFINQKDDASIKYVVWEDKQQGNFKIQVAPVEAGSFELGADPLPKDDMMIFVHNNGFLAVADTLDTMKQYIEKNLL